MLFNSYAFGLFFLLVWSVYWALRKTQRARIWWLLVASYFFYGWWDWRFLFLIAGSTLIDYLIGAKLGRTADTRSRKRLVVLSLVANLGTLGFFKYWGFFTHEVARLIESFGLEANLPTLSILLPVGISFYTFQTLSYTIDVYRKHLEPERDFARFALFVAFFPQLVAGPIVRAREFLPQIDRPPVLTSKAFESGLTLFLWGLVKKIVIADYLGRELVDAVWSNPASYGGAFSLLGIYGYALQIYGDFSGYSDSAIGIARMLGFELTKNFEAPYRATSPRDFWRRWHISLSTWLRDYLYISLGGNRQSELKTYRNLMLTMLLGGLWHGASWMFVLWGAYHGLLLSLDRRFGSMEPKRLLSIWAMRFGTFHLICLGWVFFRSATPAQAFAVLDSLAHPQPEVSLPNGVYLALLFGIGTHLLPPGVKQRLRDLFRALPPVLKGAAYALILGLLLNAYSGAAPFIYFQF